LIFKLILSFLYYQTNETVEEALIICELYDMREECFQEYMKLKNILIASYQQEDTMHKNEYKKTMEEEDVYINEQMQVFAIFIE
jgi:hypothetical protein